MSETGPWAKVEYERGLMGDTPSVQYDRRDLVDAARAAEAAQHQQAISRLTRQAQDISVTLGEAGCRAMPIVDGARWLVDHNLQLRARLAAVEAERDQKTAEVEMLRGVGCNEDGDGPCGACLKCARADRDRLEAALDRYGRHDRACFTDTLLACVCGLSAALTPQGQSTDGETR